MADDDLVIVGIHGLANKPEKDELCDWWEQSILEGLSKNCGAGGAKLDFRMVYWADRLYRSRLHRDPAYSFDNLYNTQPYAKAKPGALKEHKDGLLDDLTNAVSGWIGAGLDHVYKVGGLEVASDYLIKRTKVLRDLAFYYDPEQMLQRQDGQMDTARSVLMEVLRRELADVAGRKVMLIAHSMGTIIAYDVLRDIGQDKKHGDPAWKDFECARLVTIGSPLGLAPVKDHVYAERDYDKDTKRLRTPTVVTEDWTNFADRRDPVSADQTLQDEYGANSSDITVLDDIVRNDFVTKSGKANPHKSYGYLRTPEMSRYVAGFLGIG